MLKFIDLKRFIEMEFTDIKEVAHCDCHLKLWSALVDLLRVKIKIHTKQIF